MGIKVSENEAEILAVKDKVSQISTDYIKKEELGKLVDERITKRVDTWTRIIY